MRPEKQALAREYVERLNASPFLIAINYEGLSVAEFTDLRRRLADAGGEVHVVKNSLFRVAAKEAGLPDFGDALRGQVAVTTGEQDISVAAKAIKEFGKEAKKSKFLFGCLGQDLLDEATLNQLADLPPMDTLRGMLLGTLMAPAGQLARLLNEPAARLARVLQAKADQAEAA
jgi:large subunit ribosomal protein L10